MYFGFSDSIRKDDREIRIPRRISMSRRNTSALEDFALLPWWLCVVVAAVAYIVLKYFIPPLLVHQNAGVSPQEAFRKGLYLYKALAQIAPVAAPFAAGFFLLAAALSAMNAWRKGNLFGRQNGIETIRAINWREFEELVGEAYRRKGYKVAERGAGGPDGGVDLVLRKNGEKLLVQCKHWRIDMVGVNVVRELFGVVAAENASGGIAVSSGTFTQEAMDFAKGKPLELINGAKLAKMIAEIKSTPTPAAKRTHSINEISFNEQFSNVPVDAVQCPVCGRDMVLRTVKKGARSGEKFWGCSAFPKCRGIKPYNK
jgi:restriction system protein